MKHRASKKFWQHYHRLPTAIQDLADKNFAILKANPRHPSVHFKNVGRMWSARVGNHYRALAVESDAEFVWFWIGTHAEYNQIIKQ